MWNRAGWIWNPETGHFDLIYQNKVTGTLWIFPDYDPRWCEPEHTSVSAV